MNKVSITKVFKYRCFEPVEGLELFDEALDNRHTLWNKLVEIDRDFREKSSQIITPIQSDYQVLDQEIKNLQDSVKAIKRKTRSTAKEETRTIKDTIKELKVKRKEAYQEFKRLKHEAIEREKPLLDCLNNERKEKVKQLRSESGLHGFNFDDVIHNIYDVARIKAMKQGTLLRFKRYSKNGKIAVRPYSSFPLYGSDIHRVNTIFYIEPVNQELYNSPIRGVRKKASVTQCHIRVGSADKGKPIFVTLPMVYHRPLPMDGKINAINVKRHYIDHKPIYECLITVTYAIEAPSVNPSSCVAVDLGWRMTKDGLRAAYATDKDNKTMECIVAQRQLNEFDTIRGLSSTRQKHFNDCIHVIKAWIANKNLPDWLIDAVAYIDKWKSYTHIFELYNAFLQHEKSGNQEIVSYLEAYIERENHLRIWQSNLQDQVIAKRNYEYQNFAAKLANMYDVLVLEKLSITDIVKHQKAIIGSQQSTALDRNRTIVAPYVLKTILINAFTSRGKQFVEVNASYSTKVCHHCGALEEVHQSSIMHTCTQCHTVWDQDYNACLNLLALYNHDNKVGVSCV